MSKYFPKMRMTKRVNYKIHFYYFSFYLSHYRNWHTISSIIFEKKNYPIFNQNFNLFIMNKKVFFLVALLISFSITFSSCQVIADIFKAGMWVGIIIVVAIIALIFWLLSKFTKK